MSADKKGPLEPIDPSVENRALAAVLRGLYVSLVDEGFEPEQALKLVQTTIMSNAGVKQS